MTTASAAAASAQAARMRPGSLSSSESLDVRGSRHRGRCDVCACVRDRLLAKLCALSTFVGLVSVVSMWGQTRRTGFEEDGW
eukprot:746705-Hanusia_phi.AAC.1